VRVEFFGDEIERIHPLRSAHRNDQDSSADLRSSLPRGINVTPADKCAAPMGTIRVDSTSASRTLRRGKAARRRSGSRCAHVRSRDDGGDGLCHGTRITRATPSGRPAGSRPFTLIDFFPDDFLTIVDENRTSPCRRSAACTRATDRARPVLVEHGFRLPSPSTIARLKFDEWEALVKQRLYVSATPSKYEVAEFRRRDRGANHPPHRTARSADRGQAAQGPNRRSHGAGPPARRPGRARARHHADQAHR